MKKNVLSPVFLALFSLSILFVGCDKIDAPYGSVYVSSIDTVAFPPPSFTLNYSEPRRILVEDYTGHTCGNCPDAAILLENMIASSSGKIIGLAIHAGSTFSPPSLPSYPADFRTEAGNALDAVFGVTSAGQPNGLINRQKAGNVYYVYPNFWSNRVNDLLSASPEADAQVGIKSYYDASKGKLIAYVHAGFLEPMSGTYSLVAYVVEDSVIGDQKWYNQGFPQDHVEEYEFMHMLRGTVSPLWGEEIATDPAVGSVYRKAWSVAVNPEWNIEHLKIVAVLYNKDTYEVVQPAEVHVGD